MDWVLIDVPCSGSGTLRRNPDMKWKFTEDTIPSLVKTQREILGKALLFVKKGGRLVYATCSIFKEENQDQVKWFLENYPLELVNQISILPEMHGRDGFFGATFRVRQ
jgi:16S rRNA C967 or C1407 C5-methylase (RsmB/RsmF family)